MTGVWAGVGDHVFRAFDSRFEVDLNRTRARALSTNPEDTWGIRVWKTAPPDEMIERSLRKHDAFYALAKAWIEELIRAHRKILVLDIHSYNHRREGPDAPAAPAADNPEIDLGVTTMNEDRFGVVAERLKAALRREPVAGREVDVRSNVRYPDGGHWPEWIFEHYGDDVCTITLEYKKFYMDEWSGEVSLPIVDDLHAGLFRASADAREELAQCR